MIFALRPRGRAKPMRAEPSRVPWIIRERLSWRKQKQDYHCVTPSGSDMDAMWHHFQQRSVEITMEQRLHRSAACHHHCRCRRLRSYYYYYFTFNKNVQCAASDLAVSEPNRRNWSGSPCLGTATPLAAADVRLSVAGFVCVSVCLSVCL